MSNDGQTLQPPRKFVYPFPTLESSSGNERTTSPQTYYAALAEAEDGFYPIGYNGQWHGGIHFGSRTGTVLAQDEGVRCIADGEVIAWKVDDVYPQVEYASCGAATYSTGFVLVRHHLQLPPADRRQASDAAPTSGNGQQQEPILAFYTLYIHLLDWAGYRQDRTKQRPAHWDRSIQEVGEGANDSRRNHPGNDHIPDGAVGINLRNTSREYVGFAPRGTQLRLGNESTLRGYFEVLEVVSGETIPTNLTGVLVFKSEMSQIPPEPDEKGSIVIPDRPIPVKAGDLVGHLGQYQRYVDMNPMGSTCSERPLVQVDVFTTDDIEAFIARSRERATRLSDRHKTLLLIERGARLVPSPQGEGQPSGEQLAEHARNATGPQVALPRVVPISALDDALTGEDDARWWYVEAGDEAGESIHGWVCERNHANVRLCTPWDWPGFEIIGADNTRPDQFYANQTRRQGNTTQDEQGEIEARGQPAESGSIFQKLYDLIDLDGDKKLVAKEIREALGRPWLAQVLSQLIVQHESEWSGPMEKWDAIDDLIPEPRKKDWKKERERIESLLWWDSVKNDLTLSKEDTLTAYHFHPVGFISNFFSDQIDCLTYRILYEDGSLERITPDHINPEKTNTVRYIYVDSSETEHDLGEFQFTTAQRVGSGNALAAGTSRLIDLRDVEDYSSGDIGFGFHYDTRLTLRPYIADHALASLFGAMLDTGFDDVSCNGFSDHRGHSIGGSSSHRNGVNGDFKYFRADGTTQTQGSLHINTSPELMDEARQNSFNDALYKYGWHDLRAWRYTINGENKLLNHSQHLSNHHHHLHLQGYNPTIIDRNE